MFVSVFLTIPFCFVFVFFFKSFELSGSIKGSYYIKLLVEEERISGLDFLVKHKEKNLSYVTELKLQRLWRHR